MKAILIKSMSVFDYFLKYASIKTNMIEKIGFCEAFMDLKVSGVKKDFETLFDDVDNTKKRSISALDVDSCFRAAC